jgi:hypothetical protein
MAGDWIKWSKGLARKPEVVQIAIRLGMTRHAVAGLLMEVWEWADDNVSNLSGSEPDDCPGTVPFSGLPEQLFVALTGVAGLADAMTAVGWISTRNGSLVFPNFGRHNGKSAKTRALDSSRKQRTRSLSASRPPGVPNMSAACPDPNRTNAGPEKRREEKRREEGREEVASDPAPPKPKPAKVPAESVPLPQSLDTPAFRATWHDWLADRKSRSKGLTERAAKLQLDSLMAIGPERACECIRLSIANGWTGLFAERFTGPTDSRPAGGQFKSAAERSHDQLVDQIQNFMSPPELPQ